MRLRYLGIILVTGLLILLGHREWLLMPDGTLHIRFLNIGQGDAVLIRSPEGKHMLIDGGPDWSVLERLGEELPFFRRRIDVIVNTHPDIDHIGGLLSVLSRYDVGLLILPYADHQPPLLGALRNLAREHRVPIRMMEAGESVSMGSGTLFSVLWPPKIMPKGFSKSANNHSLVLLLEHKNRRALFVGDIEESVERTLTAARADMRADILKVGHHGSKSSSGTGFLVAVDPTVAVISAGKDNSFGHPRPEIIKRLHDLGITVRRTDEEGTIDMSW